MLRNKIVYRSLIGPDSDKFEGAFCECWSRGIYRGIINNWVVVEWQSSQNGWKRIRLSSLKSYDSARLYFGD